MKHHSQDSKEITLRFFLIALNIVEEFLSERIQLILFFFSGYHFQFSTGITFKIQEESTGFWCNLYKDSRGISTVENSSRKLGEFLSSFWNNLFWDLVRTLRRILKEVVSLSLFLFRIPGESVSRLCDNL